MGMHDIELADSRTEGFAHLRGEVDAPDCRGKVADTDAIQLHRSVERYVRDALAIDVCREDFYLMAAPGQSLAQAVDGEDRTTVARCREIGGNDVEDAHASQPIRRNRLRTSITHERRPAPGLTAPGWLRWTMPTAHRGAPSPRGNPGKRL